MINWSPELSRHFVDTKLDLAPLGDYSQEVLKKHERLEFISTIRQSLARWERVWDLKCSNGELESNPNILTGDSVYRLAQDDDTVFVSVYKVDAPDATGYVRIGYPSATLSELMAILKDIVD